MRKNPVSRPWVHRTPTMFWVTEASMALPTVIAQSSSAVYQGWAAQADVEQEAQPLPELVVWRP